MDAGVDNDIVLGQIVPGFAAEEKLGGLCVSGRIVAVKETLPGRGIPGVDRKGYSA